MHATSTVLVKGFFSFLHSAMQNLNTENVSIGDVYIHVYCNSADLEYVSCSKVDYNRKAKTNSRPAFNNNNNINNKS